MMAGKIEGTRQIEATLEMLDALSRTRALTPRESRQLENAVRQLPHERCFPRWTAGDVARLQRYLLRGKRPKQIAILMNRTERAVWRKMYKQGWTVKALAPPEPRSEKVKKEYVSEARVVPDGLVTARDAAEAMGVTHKWLLKQMRHSNWPHVQIGGRFYCREEDVSPLKANQLRYVLRGKSYKWIREGM